MARAFCLALQLSLAVNLAFANPLATSPRPQPKPVVAAPLQGIFRPKARPVGLGTAETMPQQAAIAAAPPANQRPASMKGSVCKNPEIKGLELKPVAARVRGCGIRMPVQVTSVAGVTLSPAAVINCEEAQALATWVVKGVQPAFRNTVAKMTVADSYSCRPRNNVPGAKISEHGTGNAIDISAFITKTGKTYTVASNYNSMIRAAQKAGCGIFHTILGPGSDGYHENHLHFDVAPYRGNPYCR